MKLNLMAGLFLVAVAFLFLITAYNYAGEWYVYLLFTIAFNALFLAGFRKERIFFDTFIGILFWLGFWLKFSMRVAFLGGNFMPVGAFDASSYAYDYALTVASCGAAGLLVASYIREQCFSYNRAKKAVYQATPEFYYRHKKIIWLVFAVVVLFFSISNGLWGIYQRGRVPVLNLPYYVSGMYTWLLFFGLASISALILNYEVKVNSSPYAATILMLLESFLTNISMLSRGIIINVTSLLFGINEAAKSKPVLPKLKYKIVTVLVFAILFICSISIVNYLRTYKFTVQQMPGPARVQHVVASSAMLILDRWVGLEGVLAVTSHSGLGWDLWARAWDERYSGFGTSMYDKEILIDSPYRSMDVNKHNFVTLPGIIAFLYYPGSLWFLFIGMCIVGFLGASIEILTYRFGGANVILCALLANVAAYRFVHSGYIPRQSYLLFGTIIANVFLILLLEKILIYFGSKKAPT